MAVKEIVVDRLSVAEGGLVADVQLKTDTSKVGMRLVFELAREKELGAAVTLLENAVEAAMMKNLGITAETGAAS